MNKILLFSILLIFSVDGVSQKGPTYQDGKYDTIFVSHPSRNVKITFDKFDYPPAVDIGTYDFAAKVLGCCDVVLKAAVEHGKPTSLYIRYGDKYYNGTIAYMEDLPLDDEVIDFRNKEDLPEPLNSTRAITSNENAPSMEKQVAMRRLGILEGREKDRYSSVATVNEKIFLKMADVMQDDNYLYIKLGVFNKSKADYAVSGFDFLFRNRSDEMEFYMVQPKDIIYSGKLNIQTKGEGYVVAAFPKFNISSRWELLITLKEKGGGRSVELVVSYDHVVNCEKF